MSIDNLVKPLQMEGELREPEATGIVNTTKSNLTSRETPSSKVVYVIKPIGDLSCVIVYSQKVYVRLICLLVMGCIVRRS